MEEHKSHNKLSRLIIILVIAVTAIIAILAYLMYSQKIEADKQIAELKESEDKLQATVAELQGKLGNISDIASLDTIESEKEVDISKVLEKYKEVISSYNQDTGWIDNMYAIQDITKDGIPELFIYTCKNEGNVIDGHTTVFKYDSNSSDTIEIGKIEGRIDLNTSIYMMNDGRILAVYGYMGYEKTTYYEFLNDQLVKGQTSEEREVNENDDYVSGDKLIDFKECSDMSLINNYK